MLRSFSLGKMNQNRLFLYFCIDKSTKNAHSCVGLHVRFAQSPTRAVAALFSPNKLLFWRYKISLPRGLSIVRHSAVMSTSWASILELVMLKTPIFHKHQSGGRSRPWQEGGSAEFGIAMKVLAVARTLTPLVVKVSHVLSYIVPNEPLPR